MGVVRARDARGAGVAFEGRLIDRDTHLVRPASVQLRDQTTALIASETKRVHGHGVAVAETVDQLGRPAERALLLNTV